MVLFGTMKAVALDFGLLVLEIGDLISVVGLLAAFRPGIGGWQDDGEGKQGEKQAFQATHTRLSAVGTWSNRPSCRLVLFLGPG